MPDKSEAAAAAELLRHRPGKKGYTTKDRTWERKKRHDEKTTQVSFRDFPRTLNGRLKEIAGQEGKTVAQVAIAWLLANPAITAPIIGANTVAQLTDTMGALSVKLTDEERATLDEMSVWE